MKIPEHIAIIPDGNRRWAKAHRLNPWEGHAEGSKRFWEISYEAFDQGVQHITFWGSSYDNLKKRSALEVKFLIKLLGEEIQTPKFLNNCIEKQARFKFIGEWRGFIEDKKTLAAIEYVEKSTDRFTKSLTILFGYDGQREMLSAMNLMHQNNQTVSNMSLRKNLWTGYLPDVDLVIRTGGEPHWSAGFMMWLTANSQFYFTDMLWPDFRKEEFRKSLAEYDRRERRLGK